MSGRRYQCGERVIVRDDLDIAKYYNNIGVTKAMLDFRGKHVTVSQFVTLASSNRCYRIVEDSGNWIWTDDMFCEISYEDIDDTEDFRLLYEEFVNGRLHVQ